jgi:hypothetical protein
MQAIFSDSSGSYDVFSMGTVNMNGGTASGINVYAYCSSTPCEGQATNFWDIAINTGSGWSDNQPINCPCGSNGWGSITFTGRWTQTQIDALQVRATARIPDFGEAHLDELYATIAYT